MECCGRVVFTVNKKWKDIKRSQKILKDSDVLQSMFKDDYINQIVIPLSTEWNKDLHEMLSNQIGFLENLTFCTKWANDKCQYVFPKVLKVIPTLKIKVREMEN